MRYDVLTEGWIPVEDMHGEVVHVGIREALVRAHELRAVRAGTPPMNYGINRFLIAFVSDMLRPERHRDIGQIVKAGKFEEQAVDAYIAACRAEGVSFDLFDEKRPFMQEVFPKDAPTEYAVKLFPELPEGNNHTHFTHILQATHAFTPARCMQSLTAVGPFAMMFGRSAALGINGAPPVYFLYAGDNLFETVALSMMCEEDYPKDHYAHVPVAWRDTTALPEGESVVTVSYLSGLTARPRGIQLIPEETESGISVKLIHYRKGYAYKEYSAWRDPHVAYYKKKDENVYRALLAQEDRGVWRDIGTVLSGEQPPKLLDNVAQKGGNSEQVPLKAYRMVSKQKGTTRVVMSWSEEDLPLYLYLIEDAEKTGFLAECLSFMDDMVRLVGSAMAHSLSWLKAGGKSKDKGKSPYSGLAAEAKAQCYAQMRPYVLGEFAVTLQKSGKQDDWKDPLRIAFGTATKRCVDAVFADYCERVQAGGKLLEWQARAGRWLRMREAKRMEGGWKKDGKR